MMDTDLFFRKIRTYCDLGKKAEDGWSRLLRPTTYQKGDDFLRIGDIPTRVAFVVKGLFAQYFFSDSGDAVIKYFFPEGRIAGSIPATLAKTGTLFAIPPLS